jgi:DNA-binding transcriptional LysR family regulator
MVWAEEIVSSAENVRRYVGLLGEMSTGKLVIGTGAYFADSVLATAVGNILMDNPLLNIKIIRGAWKDVERLLLKRQVDLFLGWTDEAATSKDIAVTTILSDPIVLFCRKQHPLMQRDKMDLKDVLEFPMVGPMVPEELLERINRFRYKYTGIDRPLLAVEFDSYSEVRKIAEISDCVGGLPESCMIPYFKDGQLVKLPVTFPGLKGRAGISYLKGRTLLPATKLIIEELTKIVLTREREVDRSDG